MSGSRQKSSGAQACNLRGQYLKENGRFADICNLGMTPKLESNKVVETSRMQPGTTMNLLPNQENSAENSRQNNNTVKAIDFFQDIPSFGSPSTISGHGSSQMTILYAGKVLVFNDFPAVKVKEIMAIASKGSTKISNGGFLRPPPSAADKATSSRAVTPDLNMAPTSDNSNSNNIATPEGFHPLSQAVPIARRASLLRFFEKRKGRATARAPYQVNNLSPPPMASSPQKPEDQSKFPWLELGAQSSKQLDLKL